ncbi:Ribonuclease II [Forsythia ovata]|uniref:Ribonuclease II n=1 Tax=Forsythia ovata TaxID=205694 RepID=A0ABD1QCA5_9LAMI
MFIVELFCRLELKSSEELLENKSGKRMLQKGLLLEFKKDSEKVLLAVAQKPGSKNNWMVSDQDLTLLEFAWIELLEKNKLVRVEELAKMIFGSVKPLESYCVHLLLSNDDKYFTVLESKCLFSVYGPRPAVQVDELLRMKHAKEAVEKELKEFVKLLKSARKMPSHSKPAKSLWRTEEKIRHRIESLEAYAIDKHYISLAQNFTAVPFAGVPSLEARYCRAFYLILGGPGLPKDPPPSASGSGLMEKNLGH